MARRQRGTQDTFTGRSGQQAVLAELLARQCNAAVPEVDLGHDVFAFRDHRTEIARLQVKTSASARRYKRRPGYVARFNIPIRQLVASEPPELWYVFAVRLEQRWTDFLVMGRSVLAQFFTDAPRFGYRNLGTGELELRVVFDDAHVWCDRIDLSAYRNAWELLPPLRRSTDGGAGTGRPFP